MQDVHIEEKDVKPLCWNLAFMVISTSLKPALRPTPVMLEPSIAPTSANMASGIGEAQKAQGDTSTEEDVQCRRWTGWRLVYTQEDQAKYLHKGDQAGEIPEKSKP
ncbi:hypothetical protein HO173_001590 [Letharia columbiana]|uniref:Uncharacterized protein n=1 Tax=Letharia columbiana TaxID=112416 RepID=A0A8H6L8S4_9LECA|nr:uncharacterized protein HO173_001590 [Letharia columbiana]KAF6239982.1 hypothetical protein HO173_001590 [Letharia columbiana]